MRFERICILVFDSLGIGALPDAEKFGDSGANTLGSLLSHRDLKIPNLRRLGLTLANQSEPPTQEKVSGFFGRMVEISRGKDTTTGHWEMMGLCVETPLSDFPKGFPADLMKVWSEHTGHAYLGNKPASGTVIIEELGAEHLQTKSPIIYTSADSVFQIACHEEIFGLQDLYDLCAKTRKIIDASPFKVGRVIARPFVGKPGSFRRTGNRRDFALDPWAPTALNALRDANVPVVGVGKIPSIYNYSGISEILESHNDQEAIGATLKALSETPRGLIFTNLNDLDMLYGHRRDLEGYAKHLEFLDQQLSKILTALKETDLLVLTADHGNDPGFRGTDHTREFVPLLLTSPTWKEGVPESRRLPDRKTFSDLGQTISENFQAKAVGPGTSFLFQLNP